jgi:hypothetical protein
VPLICHVKDGERSAHERCDQHDALIVSSRKFQVGSLMGRHAVRLG